MSNLGALRSRAKALGGKAKASESPDLFDPRGFLWSNLSNWWDEKPIGVLKVQLFHIGQPLF